MPSSSGPSTAVVVSAIFGGCTLLFIGIYLLAWHTVSTMSPAGIVRRLLVTGRPVTVAVDRYGVGAWDPSSPVGRGGFYGTGTVTYSLEGTSTIHARFAQKSGNAVERSGAISPSLLPDPPEARRRRKIARIVVGIYFAVGAAAFVLPIVLVGGSSSIRVRIGALSAVGSITIAWLGTHAVLTRRRAQSPHARAHHPLFAHAKRLAIWGIGLLTISAVLAVAWHLGSTDQPRQVAPSWASAFIDSVIFVFACTATIAAASHHHTYVHHTDRGGGSASAKTDR